MSLAQIMERPTGARKENPKRIEVRRELEAYRLRNERVSRNEATNLFKQAAHLLGASHAQRNLMDLLFKRSQPQDWENGLAVVWPSNETLAHEMGIEERSVQKLLSVLTDKGWISHVDSPTGRRLGFRDETNAIIKAWGIDLTPLALLAGKMEEIVEADKFESMQRRATKAKMTGARKRISGIVAYAFKTYPDDHSLHIDLETAIEQADEECMASRRGRKSSKQLQSHLEALEAIIVDLEEFIIPSAQPVDKSDGNDPSGASDTGPHEDKEVKSTPQDVSDDTSITTLPNSTNKLDSCGSINERSSRSGGSGSPASDTAPAGTEYFLEYPNIEDGPHAPPPIPIDKVDPLSKAGLVYSHFQTMNVTPHLIWETCLRFAELLGDKKPNWRNLVDLSITERHDLGINQSAWNEAVNEMSLFGAAASVFVIGEMTRQGGLGLRDEVRSPGGYLRYLTKNMKWGMTPDLGPKLYGLRSSWKKAFDPDFNKNISPDQQPEISDGDDDDLPF